MQDRSEDSGFALRITGHNLVLTGRLPTIWPSVVALVDSRSGESALTATGLSDVTLIDTTDDGTMYVTSGAHGRYRLSAIRITGTATGFLGSTRSADTWPDACRLLTAAHYEKAYPGIKPTLKPQRAQQAGAELPAPNRCRFLPPAIDGTEVTVTVSWLPDNAAEADQMATLQDPSGRDPTRTVIGKAERPALRWDDTNTGVDRQTRERLSFAVGRCVANVETFGDHQPLPALAGVVADNLADPAVAPGCA